MNKTFNYYDKFKAWALIIIPCAGILLAIVTCGQSDQELKPKTTFNEFMLEARSVKNPTTSNAPMPGDTIYTPIAWGSQLRVIPGLVLKSYHPKFGDYWFCKTMAYSRVKPANYMQDSTRERVAFADSVLITSSDTFYICRRKIL